MQSNCSWVIVFSVDLDKKECGTVRARTNRIARKMTQKFEEASHPIFCCAEPFLKRDLKSKKGKETIHFESMCFILRLAPCFVATARAALLSALACIRNDSPISSGQLVRKSAQLILRWTRQQFPVLDIRSFGEIDYCNTECKMCFSSSLGHRPSQHPNIP